MSSLSSRSIFTCKVCGLLSKNGYAISVDVKLMMKLFSDLCLECTRLALSLGWWLTHSMAYLFLNMVLSHIGMSLFFTLALSPCTVSPPLSNIFPKSLFEMYPLSVNTFPKRSFASAFHTCLSLPPTLAPVRQGVRISPLSLHR